MLFLNNHSAANRLLQCIARSIVITALLSMSAAFAQTKPKVQSIEPPPSSAIYIGNSFYYYNNSLHGHVTQLLGSATPAVRMRAVSATISGSGWDWHDVESYFRPNALASYTFDRSNNIVFSDPKEKLFDVAIMMDCSQCPIHPQLKKTFVDFAKKHSDTVRKHGAKPVFFMSWAYADKPEMTEQLAEAYTKAANENGAFVIPAGLAFAKSIAKKPGLELYAPDKRHPSLAGTYLAACTVYASLFKKSPVGLKYSAGLDDATALHLQTTAWETVQGYFN